MRAKTAEEEQYRSQLLEIERTAREKLEAGLKEERRRATAARAELTAQSIESQRIAAQLVGAKGAAAMARIEGTDLLEVSVNAPGSCSVRLDEDRVYEGTLNGWGRFCWGDYGPYTQCTRTLRALTSGAHVLMVQCREATSDGYGVRIAAGSAAMSVLGTLASLTFKEGAAEYDFVVR
ncbi:MAG: hypothetical protein HY908_17285 [Myxococcales bacterium]|nr:hypothetical protein [Myxococcales bacterium]